MVKEQKVKYKLNFIILLIYIAAICLNVKCVYDDYCGSGNYKCRNILSTLPHNQPIKFDTFSNAILFDNGDLLRYSECYEDPKMYSLKQICNSDSICDIVFYDDWLDLRNYSNSQYEISGEGFILILTPTKGLRWNGEDSITMEFGNIGPDNNRLINALSIDINYIGRMYVVDWGDSSVKVYNNDGTFCNRWDDIGRPYRLKLYNSKVYILDRSSDSIKEYSFEGQYIRDVLNTSFLRDIIAFDLQDDKMLWVVDQNGQRITRIDFSGTVMEVKNEYCYKDVTFTFKNVVFLFSIWDIVYVVDYEANYILDIAYITYL